MTSFRDRKDQDALEVFKLYAIYFLTVIIREADRESRLPIYLKNLR